MMMVLLKMCEVSIIELAVARGCWWYAGAEQPLVGDQTEGYSPETPLVCTHYRLRIPLVVQLYHKV